MPKKGKKQKRALARKQWAEVDAKTVDGAGYDPWGTNAPAKVAGQDQPDTGPSYDPWGGSAVSSTAALDYDPWAEAEGTSTQQRKVSLSSGSSLLASTTLKTTLNSFEQRGCDPKQVRKRWQEKCPRKGCKLPGCAAQAVRLADLQALCSSFWKITAEERAQLLQATYGLQSSADSR